MIRRWCAHLTEEDVAEAIDMDAPSDVVERQQPCWIASCCTSCSGKLHRVLRKQELLGLALGPVDPYAAWRMVDEAEELDGGVIFERLPERVQVAFVVRLLVEEETLRFEDPAAGLAKAELAWVVASKLDESWTVEALCLS